MDFKLVLLYILGGIFFPIFGQHSDFDQNENLNYIRKYVVLTFWVVLATSIYLVNKSG